MSEWAGRMSSYERLISVKRQSHPVLGSLKFLYFLINVILQGILHFFNGID